MYICKTCCHVYLYFILFLLTSSISVILESRNLESSRSDLTWNSQGRRVANIHFRATTNRFSLRSSLVWIQAPNRNPIYLTSSPTCFDSTPRCLNQNKERTASAFNSPSRHTSFRAAQSWKWSVQALNCRATPLYFRASNTDKKCQRENQYKGIYGPIHILYLKQQQICGTYFYFLK